MNLENTLQQIGLTNKEAKVYLACLSFPDQATSTIAKKTDLNRGTTFVILEKLLHKGFVTKSISTGMARFSASPPAYLITYLENQQQTLHRQQDLIQDALPHFLNLSREDTRKPTFEFHEGTLGLQKLLSSIMRGEHTKIKCIISPKTILTLLGENYWNELMDRQKKKGYQIDMLLAFDDHKDKVFVHNPAYKILTRYMPEPIRFPMSMFLFGNTAILLSQKDAFGLLITSSEYTHMQETFFDTIWAISKREIKDSDFRMPII